LISPSYNAVKTFCDQLGRRKLKAESLNEEEVFEKPPSLY
jgi:hypothetical protein